MRKTTTTSASHTYAHIYVHNTCINMLMPTLHTHIYTLCSPPIKEVDLGHSSRDSGHGGDIGLVLVRNSF